MSEDVLTRHEKTIAEMEALEEADREAYYGYKRRRRNLAILHKALEALENEAARGRYEFQDDQILFQAASAVTNAIRIIPDPDEA